MGLIVGQGQPIRGHPRTGSSEHCRTLVGGADGAVRKPAVVAEFRCGFGHMGAVGS